MADSYRKTLIVSLVIVWFSVFVKYDSIAFLSRNSEKNSNSNSDTTNRENSRIRDAIKDKYHQAVDHKESNSNSRIRQAISDKIHRVSDKLHHKDSNPSPYQPQPQPPPYQSQSKPSPYQPQSQPSPYQLQSQPSPYQFQSKPSPYQPQSQPSPFQYKTSTQYGNQLILPYNQYQHPNPHPAYPYHQPNVQSAGGYPYPQADYQNLNQFPIDKSSKSSIMKSVAKKIFYAAKSHHNAKSSNKHNFQSGIYNDYNYRPDRYSSIRGETCFNYLEYDGIVYGQFICPIEGFSYEASYCCGPPREQYCCTLSEFNAEDHPFGRPHNEQYIAQRFDKYFLFILIPIFLIICVIIGLCVFLIIKKKTFIYSLIRRNDNNENTTDNIEDNKQNEIGEEKEKEKLNEE